ncbi:TB2/DP1/HVA22-related protein [Trema orientale]|uniref:TB2/DP1/HVA22-related protein n=1 Tax=Trema orientale TaxID=63057 RepID=A0A2P5F7F7_TREOI|nr:TB2/DP1/HVA22-related protein [Trema orientale]
MGLLGFLQFSLKYWLHDLAWPLLALVYPLCASVKAIEANSVSDTQKLNTYWVVFSLLLLLEHALKLLEWFPFWPYIRLITVCSLLMPYFDGAFYVYNHIICPCLSMGSQIIINLLAKLKQTSVERETILAEVEKYVRENGTEALEKIIACKSGSTKNPEVKEIEAFSPVDDKVVDQSNTSEPKAPSQDIKVVEVIEKNEVKAAIQVSQVEPKLTRGTENRTSLPTKTKEIVPEVTVQREHLPLTPAPKIVQKEGTCAMCHVTAQSETTFVSHLQAEKHKAMEEAVKAKSLTFSPKINATYVPKKPDQPAKEEPGNSTKNQTVSPKVVFSYMQKQSNQPTDEPGNQTTLTNGRKQTVITHDITQGKPKINISASSSGKKSDYEHKEEPKKSVSNSEMKQQTRIKTNTTPVVRPDIFPRWCRVCNVSCTSKIDMESHLRGRRHLLQVQLLRSAR